MPIHKKTVEASGTCDNCGSGIPYPVFEHGASWVTIGRVGHKLKALLCSECVLIFFNAFPKLKKLRITKKAT